MKRDWPFLLLAALGAILASWTAHAAYRTGVVPAHVLAWVVCAVFVAAPVWLWWLRWRWRKRVAYTISGCDVIFDGVPVLDAIAISAEIQRTVLAWSRTTGTMAIIDGITIIFREYPFQSHGYPGWLAGISYPSTSTIIVGLPPAGVAASALGHELGHMILARAGLDPSEENLRRYHDKYGVPY